MDPPYLAFLPDPSEICNLGMGEKRGLIRELAKCPESAQEKLQKWSRRDLMEILCAEMGKERKYTGLPKQKLIEYIFRIVSLKKPGHLDGDRKSSHQSPRSPQGPSKRLRKAGHPTHIPIITNQASGGGDKETIGASRYCTNLACRATLSEEDRFCKRCSCCICLKFDDNKDPSLWLVCGSKTLSEDVSCGMSCHLECAMKHERAGIGGGGGCTRLDGSFYCVYCGRTNELLGCWRKQLMVAKDARRTDVLCYRISLSHRILLFTEKYQKLHSFVDSAMKKLRDEIGPLDDVANMGRGIVNRLSVGSEVQQLCSQAVASLDSFLENKSPADPHMQEVAGVSPSSVLKFKDVSPKSITVVLDSWEELSKEPVGFALWHRRAVEEYPTEPTFGPSEREPRFVVAELAPSTEYAFKLVASGSTGELGNWEARARTDRSPMDAESDFVAEVAPRKRHKRTPKESICGTADRSSEVDVASNAAAYQDLNRFPESCFGYDENPCILDLEKSPDDACKEEEASRSKGSSSGLEPMDHEDTPGHSISTLDEEPTSTIQPESESQRNEIVTVPNGCTDSSPTEDIRAKPSSRVLVNEMPPLPLSPSKKRSGGAKCEQLCVRDESPEGEYERCVKVIRWLECEGHIETSFRVKLLTWFSLRATAQERRVVGVFVDTLIDDPGSLAGQLVDAFSEAALCSRRRHSPTPTGFCSRLWH